MIGKSLMYANSSFWNCVGFPHLGQFKGAGTLMVLVISSGVGIARYLKVPMPGFLPGGNGFFLGVFRLNGAAVRACLRLSASSSVLKRSFSVLNSSTILIRSALLSLFGSGNFAMKDSTASD